MEQYIFIQVTLLSGWNADLWYKINSNYGLRINHLFKTRFVFLEVPLRSKSCLAFITKIDLQKPSCLQDNITIKEVLDPHFFITNEAFYLFIQKISSLFGTKTNILLKRLAPFLKLKNGIDSTQKDKFASLNDCLLTPEQKAIANKIIEQLGKYSPILLQGVTGSGKSQIYLELINHILSNQESILFIVPEVSLAINFYNFFKNYIPEKTIHYWHSGKTDSTQKKNLWLDLQSKKPILVIGVHQPIFLPLENIGAIIIDEEHEQSFTEQQSPYLNTKQIAFIRAQLLQIPIILGSATPSISSYFLSQKAPWINLKLTKRFMNSPLPQASLIKLEKKGKNYWLSEELEAKIKSKLEQKEQVLLFINRRGFASAIKCKHCNFIFECLHCSVKLTLHKSLSNESQMICHYCNYFEEYPSPCQKCNSKESFLFKGVGIDQVVTAVNQIFPSAKILKADSSSIKKKNWQESIKNFEEGKYDILIGTKSITKGFHFPNVSLVAILCADLDFCFPEYNVREVAIQQLLQVGGRAGRGTLKGELIIQAFDTELCATYSSEDQYEAFLENELESRKNYHYPPFSKLIFIEVSGTEKESLDKNLNSIKKTIAAICKKQNFSEKEISISGCFSPSIERKKGLFYKQIILKIKKTELTGFFLQSLSFLKKTSSSFDYWVES